MFQVSELTNGNQTPHLDKKNYDLTVIRKTIKLDREEVSIKWKTQSQENILNCHYENIRTRACSTGQCTTMGEFILTSYTKGALSALHTTLPFSHNEDPGSLHCNPKLLSKTAYFFQF